MEKVKENPDGASRLVSLHDGDARPIAKGHLGKPAGFGYKAQVTGNELVAWWSSHSLVP
jgi:hypothetical protein